MHDRTGRVATARFESRRSLSQNPTLRPEPLLMTTEPRRTCDDVHVKDQIAAFLAEARRYCVVMEGDAPDNSWAFAQECLIRVLRLYERVLLLPNLEPATTHALDLICHETWQAQRERISTKLSRDYYWDVFEPFDPEKPEPTVGSISDDLADIWRDIKAGLAAIDSGKTTSISDAVWHWRFSFETHWAQHAAGAIVALTALCFGQFSDTNRLQEAAGDK
jgi:Domain of unknown function (DUF5063)